jgi:hypothetical protein
VHSYSHFLQLKSLNTFFFPERVQEYARAVFLLREEVVERFKELANIKPDLMLLALPLKADIEKVPENFQMELINLQRSTDLYQEFLKENYKIFILTTYRKINLFNSGPLD